MMGGVGVICWRLYIVSRREAGGLAPPHTLKSLCDSLSRFRGEAGCKLGRRAPSTAILIPPGSFCPLYNPSAGASGSGGGDGSSRCTQTFRRLIGHLPCRTPLSFPQLILCVQLNKMFFQEMLEGSGSGG